MTKSLREDLVGAAEQRCPSMLLLSDKPTLHEGPRTQPGTATTSRAGVEVAISKQFSDLLWFNYRPDGKYIYFMISEGECSRRCQRYCRYHFCCDDHEGCDDPEIVTAHSRLRELLIEIQKSDEDGLNPR